MIDWAVVWRQVNTILIYIYDDFRLINAIKHRCLLYLFLNYFCDTLTSSGIPYGVRSGYSFNLSINNKLCLKRSGVAMGVRFFKNETIVYLPLSKGELLRNICVTDDNGYVPFVVVQIPPFPHSWLIIGIVFSHIINRSNIIGAGTAYTSKATEFTPSF